MTMHLTHRISNGIGRSSCAKILLLYKTNEELKKKKTRCSHHALPRRIQEDAGPAAQVCVVGAAAAVQRAPTLSDRARHRHLGGGTAAQIQRRHAARS